MALEVAISKHLRGFTLDVNFAVDRAPVALLGASGSGKTVTLRAIAGLLQPDAGRIALNGRALFDSSAGRNIPCRERRIGLVFQNYALFPHLTVARNIAYGLHGLTEADRAPRVRDWIRKMRLEDVQNHYPHQVSGGQQQRVALARALAPDPEVLLLDEPLSALDVHLRGQVEKRLLETLADYRGITIFVSHNLAEAYRMCPKLVVLDGGHCVANGDTQEIFRRPSTLAVARVTGCKNFSKARKIGAERIEAADWHRELRVAQPIPQNLGHVAIRAHHISLEPAHEGSDREAENTFPCWIVGVTEGPFDVTLYLSLTASQGGSESYHLQAEVTQEHWANLKTHSSPYSLQLKPDQLFLLSD